ncbi:hypothetical protein GF718_21260 [Citrobacter braakii]|nr:hypothetical protein [Citrobacter braakii]EGT3580017.1 hypothetical protein [Citrobacter freundii]ELN3968464.1 hypothetical protein [Citrobacter freundii]MBM3063832.1 hypothetical protein [Citrobacter braakii]MBM3068730.1 hypothetical protein [Citrobacter braakii]HBC7087921.1 hypothetical protein [Citrobacter freundii]
MLIKWPKFSIAGNNYCLSHLDAKVVTVHRPATENYPARSLRVFISYSNHCFTNHYPDEGTDDLYIYPHCDDGRYFCMDRYEGSLILPQLIPGLIEKNVLLGRTLKERRETFYYLEEHCMGRDFRLFFKIDKSNHHASDIRLLVTSCHPEEDWAEPVGVQGRFTIWRIIDARINGENLAVGAQQRRRRR